MRDIQQEDSMDKNKMNEIITKHQLWIEGKEAGKRADLSGANLSGADLYRADLYRANLYRAENFPFIPMACPDFGSFIGWKKADGRLIKLLIPADAARSSAATRKCRCSKAKVLEITNLDGSVYSGNKVPSDYDNNFFYTVDETVEVEDFNPDRWEECSTGIHFFINRQEAIEYNG